MAKKQSNHAARKPRRGNSAVAQGVSPGKARAKTPEPRRGGTAAAAPAAGYSGTPLHQKLGIKPHHTVLISSTDPKPFIKINFPEGARLVRSAKSGDVILHFTNSASELRKAFPRLAKQLNKSGGLWISWPKKSSGVETDLTENTIRDIGLAAGLVDNKVCAIDRTWSGLRFVYRLRDR